MSACSKENRTEPTSEVDYMQATWVLRSWSLGVRSDHADPNGLALKFRVLQPRLLRLFLCRERFRQRSEFTTNVLEKQPPFDDSEHESL